jgi:hypothetical protein
MNPATSVQRGHSMRAPLLLCLASALLVACGAAGPRTATFDAPVPAGEPRASLRATVDLEPTSDCDERFDLALYEDRGVELVSWDDGRGCGGRRVEVRYVPGRITKDALLQRLRKISRKVNEG